MLAKRVANESRAVDSHPLGCPIRRTKQLPIQYYLNRLHIYMILHTQLNSRLRVDAGLHAGRAAIRQHHFGDQILKLYRRSPP